MILNPLKEKATAKKKKEEQHDNPISCGYCNIS